MGKRHGQKRQRRTIDLESLSKKHRKIYRDERKSTPSNHGQKTSDQDMVPQNAAAADQIENDSVSESSSSDDEVNPYQLLVQTFCNNHPKKHTDTDESSEEDSSEDENLGDNNKKIKEKKSVIGDDAAESDSEISSDDDAEVTGNKDDESSDNGSNEDGDGGAKDNEASDNNEEDSASEDDDEIHLSDLEADDKDNIFHDTDPFLLHYETDLDDKVAEELSSCKACKREEIKITGVGSAVYQWPHDALKQKLSHRKDKDLSTSHVRQSLCTNMPEVNKKLSHKDTAGLTAFQNALFPILNNYQDMLYTERDTENGEELRLLYCLHALNHILKTRKRVITHSTKLKQKTQLSVDDEYRDQGLTRPTVLMLLPFRESARRVVETFIQLLNPNDQGFVSNKKRFRQEYSLPDEKEPKKGYKPEDYEKLFDGNIDDHFRIGIGVAKKTLKLYTKFYASDIILASPLGLRTLIGSEGDRERDYDFLNSIEVLIIDQADVLMMQNWDHVIHIAKHLHLQPQESHGVDFSRVRMWTLNGWSKYYRQSLVFSSVPVPEITSLFNRHCHNYSGKYQFQRKHTAGSICQIAAQLPQVFHRIDSVSHADAPDDRFDFFIKKVFPHHSNSGMNQVLIFIPSYFDFVRLRNYFKREEINILQISEYSKDKTVDTARNLFYHRRVPYLLYTERFHFYKRVRVRGIRNIIFYGLPQYAHLYSEMCNMLQDAKSKSRVDNQTCTVLYTKFEAQRLAEIVGTDRATQMINSHKSVHMFLTGENG